MIEILEEDNMETVRKIQYIQGSIGNSFFRPSNVRRTISYMEEDLNLRSFIFSVTTRFSTLLFAANIDSDYVITMVSESVDLLEPVGTSDIYEFNENFRKDISVPKDETLRDLKENKWHAYLYLFFLYSGIVSG